MAPRGKQPPLKFPLLILLLIAFSLVLLAGYAIQLSSAATASLVSSELTAQPLPTALDTEKARDVPTKRPSPPPRPSQRSSRYDHLFAREIETEESETPIPLAYDPDPTKDPRGAPLTRPAQTVDIDAETLFINTKDRRKKRIAPMIPSIHSDKFVNEADYSRKWKIVIGIPSIDTAVGTRRRQYQRESWFKYSSVWNGGRDPNSDILVKYLLAYHPRTNYTISPELLKEGSLNKDIIFFDMKEGVWDQKKKSWAVEVGMSRKAYAWYQFAADFLKADFVMKGDDDEFIRCNLLLAELSSLNFPRVYYGRIMQWGIKKGSKNSFPFSGGMSITLSFDLIDWIRDSTIAEDNVDYYHEDVMVGRWFYSSSIPLNIVKDCRHHDIHRGANKQQQNENSLCIHHLKDSPDEYQNNLKIYPDVSIPPIKKREVPESRDWIGNSITNLGTGCKK